MSENFAEELSKWGEFTEIGIPLFDSEELTDNLIKIYLGLIASGWKSASSDTPLPLDKIGRLYLNGLSLSCVKRIAISGQVDLRNDGLADFAAIPIRMGDGDFSFSVCDRVKTLLKGWAALPFSQGLLWAGVVYRGNDCSRADRRHSLKSDALTISAWYSASASILNAFQAGLPQITLR